MDCALGLDKAKVMHLSSGLLLSTRMMFPLASTKSSCCIRFMYGYLTPPFPSVRRRPSPSVSAPACPPSLSCSVFYAVKYRSRAVKPEDLTSPSRLSSLNNRLSNILTKIVISLVNSAYVLPPLINSTSFDLNFCKTVGITSEVCSYSFHCFAS